MRTASLKLPFSENEIEQSAGGQSGTEAADFLQKTILANTENEVLNGLELGSGNGIITLMLAGQKPNWHLTGLELQPELTAMAIRNNQKLGLNCSFLQGDLRQCKTLFSPHSYDLVYANPPWIKIGRGKVSPNPVRAISRQEINCTLQDILFCSDWCLQEEGTGWLIYPWERKNELEEAARETSLVIAGFISSELYPHCFIVKLKRGF